MKKKNLGLLLLVASAGMVLASCGDKPTPSSPDEPPVSSTSDSEPAPSTSSEDEDPIDHRAPYVSDVGEGVQREFDARFDKIVDDFSGETINGETDGVRHNDYLKVLVDSNNGDFPCTPGGAIYKKGTGEIRFENGYSIGFKIRLAEGKMPLKNLILGIRSSAADNDANVYPIDLGEAYDPDGNELEELTSEFADLTVSLTENIPDDAKFPGTELSVWENEIVAFHLYAKADVEMSGVLEIAEVYAEKDGTKTVVDHFNRANVGAVSEEGGWWNGSTGFIVRKGVSIDDGAKYTAPNSILDDLKDYSKVVVVINGDATGTKVADKTWSALKSNETDPTITPVNGAYAAAVIDVAESGLTTLPTIESTTPIEISSVFLTNLEVPELSSVYPDLNPNSVQLLDDFERTDTPAADYESGVTKFAEDTYVNYAIDYAQAGKAKYDGHDLVFTPADNDNPANFVEGFKNSGNGRYLVLPMKVEGDEGLANFRFKLNTCSAHVWSTSWFAAEGLPSIPKDPSTYEYVSNGYTWYIFDLEFMGISGTITEIGIYYTGTSTVRISDIFLANDGYYSESNIINKNVDAAAVKSIADYCYVGWAGAMPAEAAYIAAGSDGVATLNSFRVQVGDAISNWGKDGLKIYDLDGKLVNPGDPMADEVTIYVIPFEENGLPITGGDCHIHAGGLGEDASISINYVALAFQGALGSCGSAGSIEGSDAYAYGGYLDGTPTKYALNLTFTADTDLNDFYFVLQDGSGEYCAVGDTCANKSELAGTAYTWLDGTPFDAAEVQKEGTSKTLVIDLNKFGFEFKGNSHIHLKTGAWSTNGFHATFTAPLVVFGVLPASLTLAALAD